MMHPGKKRIKGEKRQQDVVQCWHERTDKDNMRFGLEFEKSAFGKYNVDNRNKRNFRYMF